MTLSEKKAIAGQKGGLTTVARYGRDYMRQIGHRGGVQHHKLYRWIPIQVSAWAIVNRETGKTVAYSNFRMREP